MKNVLWFEAYMGFLLLNSIQSSTASYHPKQTSVMCRRTTEQPSTVAAATVGVRYLYIIG